MNLLALETSAETASVALLTGGETMFREGGTPGTHARFVLPWVGELLAETGLVLGRLDGIVFSAGPGSFTGLRLAVSVAQGLAMGAGLPVVAVPTLEALALAAGDGFCFCCVDARMSEVYSAAYEVAGDDVRACSPVNVGAPALLAAPASERSSWRGCGSGFVLEAVRTLPWVAGLASVDGGLAAHARDIARLGVRAMQAGKTMDPALAAPLYVRDKVARTTSERLMAGGRA